MTLEAQSAIQIQKPISAVFEGIVNPEIMTHYFISESTGGRLVSGQDVNWKFPEFEDWYPITDIELVADQSISFVWESDTVVRITLEALGNEDTLVRVSEKGKEYNEENLAWVLENTGGWANFLACLKAYLEYGIELRKGAFEFMRK
ncbi:SRPBCC domain-containing protein [Pontibacter sp. G13]|uniref:SRPBCC domain-containing protein n=1 Tax=Pontibacter sp. G13 TaxID=3074898 RepID=UPI0028898E29|nr:SRPBCC domain-containing protein [Pontibacter sp. G13]WNJ16653.1 SRPBCC domain-containing protein [Pontibacter sp. G13]